MEIKEVRLQLNNSKRSILKLPNKWLTSLGVNIESDSMDKIELVYDEKKKRIVISKI